MVQEKPIILYLDSQDFSRLAEPPPGKASFYQDLDTELSRLVASQEIEIRYSAAHISEISHTSLIAAKHSARRAQVLNRLCAGKCFAIWTDILDDEIRHNFDPSYEVKPEREDDQWIDLDLNELRGFLDKMKQSLQDTLKEKGANRKARRAAKKINLVHMLTQTSDGLAQLDSIVDRLNRTFPIEQELDRSALIAYITGAVGEQDFLNYMQGLFVDPVNLITRMAPKFDKPLKLPAIIRDQGLVLINGMNPVLEKLRNYFEALPKAQAFQSIRDDARAMPARTSRLIRRRSLRESIPHALDALHIAPVDLSDDEIDRLNVPTLDVLIGAVSQYLAEVVAASQAGKAFRLFERTDGGDLVHATYVPYVDIYRCDTAWADRLRVLGARYQTDVVGRIEELLPTLHRRLSS